MEESRVFRFSKPQWLSSASTRTAGVYIAGALVSVPVVLLGLLALQLTHGLVLAWFLLLH